MKRPLVPVALCYAGGLLLADACQPNPFLLFVISLVLTAGALCVSRVRPWLVWGLIFFTGWTNLTGRTAVLSPDDLRKLQGTEPAIVRLRGVLAKTPSQRLSMRDEKETWRSLAQVRASAIRNHNVDWQPAFGLVLVTTPGVLPSEYFAGQEVEVEGVLAPPPGALARGLFDYRAYLARQGIYYQLRTSGTNEWWKIGATARPPLADRFVAWAQQSLAYGLPEEDDPLRLLWAMTLGWKAGLTNEIYEPFMIAGTMHIFAISGLHIVLIAGFLTSTLWLCRVPRAISGWIVIPLLWFYTGATGWQPSAIRATIMMSIIIGGYTLRRPSNLLNSLAAAALIILLWDPQQLFGASFQLSFAVVLSIALLVPWMQDRVRSVQFHDPLLPTALVPWWRRAAVRPFRWVGFSFATSLACWIGALPLTAYYFHLFSPVTLLSNLLVVPLSSVALAANLASLLLGNLLPIIRELFNHSAWFFMTGMVKLSQWAATLPSAFWYIRSPSAAEMIGYGVVLLGVATGWFWRYRHRPVLWIAIGLVAILYGWRWHQDRQAMSLTILPVEGGVSIFAQPGKGENWLIDTGNENAVAFTVKPLLRARGVDSLDHLVLTHGDVRHVGGAADVAKMFGVQRVLLSPITYRSTAYRRVIREITTNGNDIVTLDHQTSTGPWYVLHPEPGDKFSRADDGAVVLALEHLGTRVLLLSDLGPTGQRLLLNRHAGDLRADILVTGLPTAGEPVSDELIEAVCPQAIIVCDADFPAAERASPQLCKRLAQAGKPVFYTRSCGAVEIWITCSGWKLVPMEGRPFIGGP